MTVETKSKPVPQSSGRGMRVAGGIANYLDERTSISVAVKQLGRKIFPDHWSFMLGEIAL